MRKEFDSEIAKKVSGRMKGFGKAWAAVALCAAVLVVGVAAATVAAGSMNGDCDQVKDQLKDGSCEETDCDQTPDQDQLQDGSCEDCVCQGDIDGDGICDNPDCPNIVG